MTSTAIAAAHAQLVANPALAKLPIWRCQNPDCDSPKRNKESDGRNWTCPKCGNTTKSKQEAAAALRPAPAAFKGSPQGYKSGGQLLLEAVEASHDAKLNDEACSTPTRQWMRERRLAGARTYSSRL